MISDKLKKLTGVQPIVDFDAADKCYLYVTTMKAMNFQDDIPSIPIDNFKDHYVLVFDLTSMQDATEKCHHLEQVGEPLRLLICSTFVIHFPCFRSVLWKPFVFDDSGHRASTGVSLSLRGGEREESAPGSINDQLVLRNCSV